MVRHEITIYIISFIMAINDTQKVSDTRCSPFGTQENNAIRDLVFFFFYFPFFVLDLEVRSFDCGIVAWDSNDDSLLLVFNFEL